MAIFEKSKARLPTTYPELHAKAAVARHCVAALLLVVRDLHVWVPAYDADDTVFGHVTELLEGLNLFYNVIMNAGMWLEADEADDADHALLRVGVHHQALAHLFMTQGRRLSTSQLKPTAFIMWGCTACPNGSIHGIRGRTATRILWGESKALQSRARRRGGL